VGHFPQDEVPALIAALLDNFITQHVLQELEEAMEATSAAAATCTADALSSGDYVPKHSIEGLMAAAALDAKV
jgi:hypothetical protein